MQIFLKRVSQPNLILLVGIALTLVVGTNKFSLGQQPTTNDPKQTPSAEPLTEPQTEPETDSQTETQRKADQAASALEQRASRKPQRLTIWKSSHPPSRLIRRKV